MASLKAEHVDARYSTFNDIARDQINVSVTQTNTHIHGDAYHDELMRELKPAIMDGSSRPECLSGTRVDIIKFILEWATNPSGKHKVLWLHGLAGSGKSTISTTIATLLRESRHLGAFLFFDRDVEERNNPANVVRTLAYQLGAYDRGLGAAITAVLESIHSISMSPIRLQFQKLVVEPLSSIQRSRPLIFILDALDECGSAKQRRDLLDVLGQQSASLPSPVLILITSRAENDIRSAFEDQPHILSQELDITLESNSDDILAYFHRRMALLCSQKRSLGRDWPGDETLRKLTKKASGLFIWAQTASNFLDSHKPAKRLEILLQGGASSGAESALDILYRTALEYAADWDDDDFVSSFRDTLGIILTSKRPLSASSIDRLLNLPADESSMDAISLLGSVLSQGDKIRVLHPSFADFLSNRNRCGRAVWYFDYTLHSRELALRCLDHLELVLKQNICNLTLSPGDWTVELADDVSYACVYWVDHVCAITDNIQPIAERLDVFLHRHLLHWLEAMSILKVSRTTIGMSKCLLQWVYAHCPNHENLVEIVSDASRFTQNFAESIEDHPLLVYTSALPFSPFETRIYRTFHSHDLFPRVVGGIEKMWSPLLLIISDKAYPPSQVLSIAFSPDGSRIVSGGDHGPIGVWDTASGAVVLPSMGPYFVALVAYSPDGRHIVSGSSILGDTTIRLWNAETGANVPMQWNKHQPGLGSMAFSPDGTLVATGLSDGTIRMWSTDSANEILNFVVHPPTKICSVTFSPNGHILASGSGNGEVGLWDAVSGSRRLPPLQGHTEFVTCVAFSPNGQFLASGSFDTSVRVWDANSGVLVFSCSQGTGRPVYSVAFSPDGALLVSGSDDGTIWVWDARTGDQKRSPLRGHTKRVGSLMFSPDGSRLASGSHDSTIRLWDMKSDAETLLPPQNVEDCIYDVTFSPDGASILSASENGIIRTWDAITGCEVLPPLQAHRQSIFSVAFSADGTLFATAPFDGGIRLWDAKSHAEVYAPLLGHGGATVSVAFSPDGHRIVSQAFDGTIQVWNVSLGSQLLFLPYITLFCAMRFSRDGNRILALDQDDDTVLNTWDVTSGARIPNFDKEDLQLAKVKLNSYSGWILNRGTGRQISKIPPTMTLRDLKSAAHENLLAIGTPNGNVFIIHFPSALMTPAN